MDRHLLIPLDGSQLAEAVLPQAVALARATTSELLLLRVVVPHSGFGAPSWPAALPVRERLDWRAELLSSQDYLSRIAAQLAAQGVRVRTEVQTGDPAGAILMRAATYPPPHMIVMATHGRSGLGRMVFGSVAEQVLHAAPVPVLLLRARDDEPALVQPPSFKTLLVPLDGSAFATQALGEATALAKATGACLELVSVVPSCDEHSLAEAGVVPAWPLPEHQARKAQMIAELEQKSQALVAQGLQVRARLGSGDPAAEILSIAAQDHVDLIVMATHGRGGWQRFFLGSTALRVLREAHKPVLLLRAEERPAARSVGARSVASR